MRNIHIVLCAVVVIIAGILFWISPYIKMDIADSAHYTEQDKKEYEFYTPDILKKMPRISSHYDFTFKNISGPDIQVYNLTFYQTENTKQIEDYLTSVGYRRQDICNLELICWRGKNAQETVYVGTLNSTKAVSVQVVEEYH